MNKLEEILEYKKKEVERLKEFYEENYLTPVAYSPSFKKAIYNENYITIIGEIKFRSPSAGEIRQAGDVLAIAEEYCNAGIDAISVLTDEKFFGGSYENLKKVSTKFNVATLTKDFIIDPIQIDIAKAFNSSAVLLIAEILNDNELMKLYEYAKKLDIDVLLEAHKLDNIKRAISINADIIGINNRNLETFEEIPDYYQKVRDLLPDNTIKVCLSTIKSREDVENVSRYGYDSALVGTMIMKAFNVGAAIRSLKNIRKTNR